jgi:hypothetical protein
MLFISSLYKGTVFIAVYWHHIARLLVNNELKRWWIVRLYLAIKYRKLAEKADKNRTAAVLTACRRVLNLNFQNKKPK